MLTDYDGEPTNRYAMPYGRGHFGFDSISLGGAGAFIFRVPPDNYRGAPHLGLFPLAACSVFDRAHMSSAF